MMKERCYAIPGPFSPMALLINLLAIMKLIIQVDGLFIPPIPSIPHEVEKKASSIQLNARYDKRHYGLQQLRLIRVVPLIEHG